MVRAEMTPAVGYPPGEATLRGCITGVRAQPHDFGAPELVELELYLMARAKGMTRESLAVRP